jgi:hypothetical protein
MRWGRSCRQSGLDYPPEDERHKDYSDRARICAPPIPFGDTGLTVEAEEKPMTRFAAVIAALLAGYGIYALAQDRSPLIRSAVATLTPIASSSSGDVSFAWFYDAANHRVYVCRASGTKVGVDCNARADLP